MEGESPTLKLSVKIPQSYVCFCFSLKFIENHKILDSRNTYEKKFETHEIPTRKSLRFRKYPRENNWDPRNNQEKITETHEIPTGKIFGPMKARWHGGTRPTRPTLA